MGIHIHLGGGRHRGFHSGNVHVVKSRRGIITFGIVFLLITTLILGIFLYVQNKNSDFIETSGIVVDNEYDHYKDTYRAVIQYEVGDNVYTIRDASTSSFPSIIGTEVAVAYNPYNPADATVKTTNTVKWIIYGIFALFYIAGICVLIKGLRMPKDNESI